jgi:lysophospholipase L1-like esterase
VWTGSPGFGLPQMAAALVGVLLTGVGLWLRRSHVAPQGGPREPSTEPPAPAPRTALARVRTGILVTLVVLLSAEVGARLFMLHRLGPRAAVWGTPLAADRYRPEDPPRNNNTGRALTSEAGYRHYPPHATNIVTQSHEGSDHLVAARINNIGFRGRDVEIPKPVNRLRVLTLGASSTFGFGNEDDNTYPAYLEEILRERYVGSKEIEVVNLGIPHVISREIATLTEDIGVRLQPDLVTFYEGVNDTQLPPTRWQRMASWSMLAMLYEVLVRQTTERFTAAHYERWSVPKVGEFIGSLDRMRTALSEHGAHFVVISQQAKSMDVEPDRIRGVSYQDEVTLVSRTLFDDGASVASRALSLALHNDLMAAQKEWATRHGVPYVDGINALDARRDVLTSWVHLTAEGNRILAEAMAPTVLALLGN